MRAIALASLMSLLRDRGAVLMAFVLPAVIFVIFAAVFSGTRTEELSITVAFADEVRDRDSVALGETLKRRGALRFADGASPGDAATAQGVRTLVERGGADAAIVIAAPLDRAGDGALTVIADPSKSLAGALAAAETERALATALPHLPVARLLGRIEAGGGALSAEQRARLDAALTAPSPEGSPQASAVRLEETGGASGNVTVTYYAGAIAIMFLLFSALQGAVTLIDERRSGIVDRIMLARRGGVLALIGGKYLFLFGLALVQAGVLFAVAGGLYGVEVLRDPLGFALTTLCAAALAAGIGLLIAACLSTRQQALALGNAAVLVLAAIGGSMMPRFMMPLWLQEIGALTPVAWTIEAYQLVLWRGAPLADVTGLWAKLLVTGLLCAGAAAMATRVREGAR